MDIDNFTKQPDLCIVIMDMQNELIKNLPNSKCLIERQIDFLSRHKEVPIIGLEYNPEFCGFTFSGIRDIIQENKRGIIISKYHSNGFKSNSFNRELETRDIDKLVFLGCYLSCCVLETAQTAFNNGYQIGVSQFLLSDSLKINKDKTEQSLDWYKKKCISFT